MTISNIERQIRILAAQLKKLKHVASPDDRTRSTSISEIQAAGLFFSLMTDRVFKDWPKIISQLREINKGDYTEDIFNHIDEERAEIELLFAAMALDLCALKNLFPKEQAERLYECCIESIPQEARDYARSTFEEYISRFNEDVKRGINPLSAVGDIIYGRWGLGGDAYVPGHFFIAPRPVVALGLCQYALSYVGVWKQIRTNFIIDSKKIDQAIEKANILACTNCGTEFNSKDYRIDAQEWLCSSCLAPLHKK
jgi:hypothetical protein